MRFHRVKPPFSNFSDVLWTGPRKSEDDSAFTVKQSVHYRRSAFQSLTVVYNVNTFFSAVCVINRN